MGTEDKRRQFDEIVANLIAEEPSLVRPARRRWRRSGLIGVLVSGALTWGLLSVAMVAWGWKGVVLACSVVACVLVAAVVDARRLR